MARHTVSVRFDINKFAEEESGFQAYDQFRRKIYHWCEQNSARPQVAVVSSSLDIFKFRQQAQAKSFELWCNLQNIQADYVSKYQTGQWDHLTYTDFKRLCQEEIMLYD